jgi:N-acetylmuramoyl-L-alanine amidase
MNLDIEVKHIPINRFSRPGKERTATKAVVVHWVGNAGQHANETARYFELLEKQDPTDEIRDVYASSQYIVGIDGKVIEVMPQNEVAYTSGGASYTEKAIEKFGKSFTKNTAQGTPNWCSISIEMCHPDETGIFTEQTIESTALLVKKLLNEYSLSKEDVMRHYDITGKVCPKWFVEHEDDYKKFLEMI